MMKNILFILIAIASLMACAQPYPTSSSIVTYNGTAPTNYTSINSNINGQFQGINTALGRLKACDDSLRTDRDSLYALIDSLFGELSASVTTSLYNSDSLVSVVDTGSGVYRVNMKLANLKDTIFEGLDFSCLTSVSTLDSALQVLIDTVCYLTSVQEDTCVDWGLYATASVTSGIDNILVTVTPYSVGAVPTGMCLSNIQYIYQVYNDSSEVMPYGYGVVNGGTTLNATKQFYISTNYLAGARTLQLLSRFQRKECGTFQDCGYLDSTVTYVVAYPPITPMTMNDTYDTIYWNGAYQTVDPLSNDVIPYAVYASGLIRTPDHGAYTWADNVLSYSPTNGYTGPDTATYFVQDIYGQRDTGNIYFTIQNIQQVDAEICYTAYTPGTADDTVVLSINIWLQPGVQFASYGAMLDFDALDTAVNLDAAAYINVTRDTLVGTVKIVVDSSLTNPTVAFSLQVVTDSLYFFEQTYSLSLTACDTTNNFSTTTTTFAYFQTGTKVCTYGDYTTVYMTIGSPGGVNADGSIYSSGVCWDSIRSTATVLDPVPLDRNWVITNDPQGTYATTDIDATPVSLPGYATRASNIWNATPDPSAYTTTVSDSGYAYVLTRWWSNINHIRNGFPFVVALASTPQCIIPLVGIKSFDCGE